MMLKGSVKLPREEYRKHMERILSKYDGRDWKKDGCVV